MTVAEKSSIQLKPKFDANSWKQRTTKEEFTRKLSVSIMTTYRYHKFAEEYVDGFVSDYPLVNKKKRYTKIGMSIYQVWVMVTLLELKRIGWDLAIIQNKLIEELETQAFFSKENFLRTIGE